MGELQKSSDTTLMRFSFSRFLLLLPVLGASLGCNRGQSAAAPPPINANAAAPGAFGARAMQLEENGDFSAMIAAARAQMQSQPGDQSARYALARGSFFNGDFALAITELQALTQTPHYAQDADALETLRIAQFLAGKYANQRFEPVLAIAGDVKAQTDEWRARGAALLSAKKYDEIEAIAAAQTRSPTIMSDGGWVLAHFYIGLWEGDKPTQNDAEWEKRHAQIVAWQAARPASQLARTCLARSWTNGAWTARGDKFANQVSRDTWKIVEERQEKAAPIYQKLLAEKVETPLVYAAAQRFGRLGGLPREWHDDLLARATTQFPTYWDFYRERAIYILPRWDGAPGEWERELAKQADAETARAGAASGDKLYARVVWGQWDFYKRMKRETAIDWPRTTRGFEAILQENPASLSALTMYMRLCYHWGESVKARELLQKVGGRADLGSWKDANQFAHDRIGVLRLLP